MAVGGGIVVEWWSIHLTLSNDAPITINEFIIVIVMMAAGIAILFAKSRMTAIILNGVLGYSIAFFFVVFRAPDLALTQIVVETVTTALFLLCFYFLPEWKKEKSTRKRQRLSMVSSRFQLGLSLQLLRLSVQGNKMFESISVYFENSYELSRWKKYCQYDIRRFPCV